MAFNYRQAMNGIRGRIIYSKNRYKKLKEEALSKEIRDLNKIKESTLEELLIMIDAYLEEMKKKG